MITVFKQFSRSLSEPLMQTDVCNSTKNFNGLLTERDICVAPGEIETTNVSVIHKQLAIHVYSFFKNGKTPIVYVNML
jgi:hypothetical protein